MVIFRLAREAAIIESILTSFITIWYAATTAKDKIRVQRIIRTAEKVIGCNLPTLEYLHTSRTLRRARKIVADSSHPGHTLFQPLPSGRRLRSIRTKTSCHKNSFVPYTASLFNKAPNWHWHSVTLPHTLCHFNIFSIICILYYFIYRILFYIVLLCL